MGASQRWSGRQSSEAAEARVYVTSQNRTDYLLLLYSSALLCTSVINKHFYGRRFILPYKSKEERTVLRHQYGWALLLRNTTRGTRATDLNLRRLQSSHCSWLDGRDRKRLRQDIQQCTVNQWDSQSKKPNPTVRLVRKELYALAWVECKAPFPKNPSIS